MAALIAGCDSTSEVASTTTTRTPTPTQAPTTTQVPATTQVVTTPPTTSTEAVADSVAAKEGCEVTPAGPLLDARSPARPYFLHHPAEASTDTATIMFLPGGSTGSRNAAERVWASYLSQGEGVDDFRVVIPYATGFDLYDDENRVLAIVEEVLACHGGDPSQFHIAGYSRGGQIAFGLMLRRPDLFATALGAPGEFFLVEPDRWREDLAGKAFFNGVGSEDEEWLPFVKAIHEGLVEAGIESLYVEFPGEGHRLSSEFDESIFFDFWSSH